MQNTMKTLPTAHKHRLAVTALSLVKASIDILKPQIIDASVLVRIDKVERWHGLCCEQTKERKFSAGARRDTDRAFKLASDLIGESKTVDDYNMAWAATLWAGSTLLNDIKRCGKDYTQAKRHWHYLDQCCDGLCNALAMADMQVAEMGTDIYMEIAP